MQPGSLVKLKNDVNFRSLVLILQSGYEFKPRVPTAADICTCKSITKNDKDVIIEVEEFWLEKRVPTNSIVILRAEAWEEVMPPLDVQGLADEVVKKPIKKVKELELL